MYNLNNFFESMMIATEGFEREWKDQLKTKNAIETIIRFIQMREISEMKKSTDIEWEVATDPVYMTRNRLCQVTYIHELNPKIIRVDFNKIIEDTKKKYAVLIKKHNITIVKKKTPEGYKGIYVIAHI